MRLFLILLLLLPCRGLYANNLHALIGPSNADSLLAGETLIVSGFRNPRPALMPANDSLRGHLERTLLNLEPSVMVETLQLYAKPAGANRGRLSPSEEAALYNGILSLSTLTGLEYFSESRGSMRTFYEVSTVIDGPSTRMPLPDPVFPGPQRDLTLYARQKDLTFGDNIYQYDFYHSTGAIIFIQQNLSPLSLSIIPAIGRNRLRSIVAVLDAEDYLLIYAASMARAVSLPGMNERVSASFANRANAIFNWFSGIAGKALEPGN
ncbi:MAG: hypothetical protein FWG77_02335 [Treponema sp.]|nr:hypothetical protein [Treponema sp.]